MSTIHDGFADAAADGRSPAPGFEHQAPPTRTWDDVLAAAGQHDDAPTTPCGDDCPAPNDPDRHVALSSGELVHLADDDARPLVVGGRVRRVVDDRGPGTVVKVDDIDGVTFYGVTFDDENYAAPGDVAYWWGHRGAWELAPDGRPVVLCACGRVDVLAPAATPWAVSHLAVCQHDADAVDYVGQVRAMAARWAGHYGRTIPTADDAARRVDDYDSDVARDLARWYMARENGAAVGPDLDTVARWEHLADIVGHQYRELAAILTIDVVDDDPYADADAMRADVARGHLAVMRTAPGSHPLWSDAVNDKFRAVHDALGHAAHGVGFDRYGEDLAYRAHAATMPRAVWAALACETRAQNAALVHGPTIDGRAPGTFARQVCHLVPSWAARP